MERKVHVKQGPVSPRGEPFDEEEDVLDYPGLDDESNGSGPVSREAHIALRKAFQNLKKRLLEAEARISELQGQLKQRDKKGSLEKVYQERDELLGHLQKSYNAFKEKYGENEELKKMIQELKHKLSLKSSQEAMTQSKGDAQPGSTSEEEGKLEKKKYTTIIEELKTIGLEVIEENDQLYIILTDRDNLKKWIEEKSDGNITIHIKGSTSEDKATATEMTLTRQEDYEQAEGKRKRVQVEAEVILLRQKIEDQAQELNRFYTVFKEVMTQNKNLRAKEQSTKEIEDGNTKGLPTSKPTESLVKRPTAQEKTIFQKKADTMLSTAQEQVVEMREVKKHLDQQNISLRALKDITEKTTSDFERLVSAPKARQNFDDSQGIYPEERSPRWPEEGAMSLPQGQSNREEENNERVFSDDAPLSMPVQESNLHRFKSSGVVGESVFAKRFSGERNFVAPSSAVSRGAEGAEGRAVPTATYLTENTWTGESDDIEVIEEEEDFIGATPSQGKICPVCERFFPDSYGQSKFELHVDQHFADDA